MGGQEIFIFVILFCIFLISGMNSINYSCNQKNNSKQVFKNKLRRRKNFLQQVSWRRGGVFLTTSWSTYNPTTIRFLNLTEHWPCLAIISFCTMQEFFLNQMVIGNRRGTFLFTSQQRLCSTGTTVLLWGRGWAMRS